MACGTGPLVFPEQASARDDAEVTMEQDYTLQVVEAYQAASVFLLAAW